jgi:hypothetical protein
VTSARVGAEAGRQRGASLRGIYVVWVLIALTAVAVFETYWRIPPAELWKVHNSGFVGGAGRAFVFVSFSPALAALAILAVVVDRLDNRRADLLGLVAAVLCATVAVPGVQTPSHLDPKWANLPAVVGVALAFTLTVWASRSGRPDVPRATRAGDLARLAVGGVATVLSAPYIAAELGFFLDGVPVLGWLFQTGVVKPEPGGGQLHAAVHHGHHHGMDGLLLTLTALIVSRQLGTIRRPLLRTLTALFLALMLVYGLTNLANDLWIEQVVKRDWTRWEIPEVLQPSLSAAWAAMIVCGLVIYALWLRPRRERVFQRPVGSTSSIHSDIGT